MKLVNKTPHTVNILYRLEGNKKCSSINLKPADNPARVNNRKDLIKTISPSNSLFKPNIPLYTLDHGKVTNLPEKRPDTLFIVSRAVARASDREDLLVPTDTVRDEEGNIKGCKGFIKWN